MRSRILPIAPPRIIASARTSPFAFSRVIQKATATATSAVTATRVQRCVSSQRANIDSEMPQFSAHCRLKIGSSAIRRSEEHTSELQSLMRISYAVFCLTKNNQTNTHTYTDITHNKHQHQKTL